MIRADDHHYLMLVGSAFSVTEDSSGTHLVIRDYVLPGGLTPGQADLLITLPPGFPDVGPDMFWLAPNVVKASGAAIAGTEAQREHDGRTWQRWSRHIGQHWRAGIDDLRSYLRYVARCLGQEAEVAA